MAVHLPQASKTLLPHAGVLRCLSTCLFFHPSPDLVRWFWATSCPHRSLWIPTLFGFNHLAVLLKGFMQKIVYNVCMLSLYLISKHMQDTLRFIVANVLMVYAFVLFLMMFNIGSGTFFAFALKKWCVKTAKCVGNSFNASSYILPQRFVWSYWFYVCVFFLSTNITLQGLFFYYVRVMCCHMHQLQAFCIRHFISFE